MNKHIKICNFDQFHLNIIVYNLILNQVLFNLVIEEN